MIHAICDFCGQDCDRTALFLTITPFQNFGRHHADDKPYGQTGQRASFVMCSHCLTAHCLPNPYDGSEKKPQKMTYRAPIHSEIKPPVQAEAFYKALHAAGGFGGTDDETRGYDRGIDTAISLLNEMTGVDAECLDEDEAESDGEAPWD